ncbi:LysR family transcriptional regulator [Candidatus Burkholderia verschuerenii]|uniref:LysR family transcriptional regulator n=1 Tax=Candidatus Burkholderia verschuerenii TaxID=242163 RepID=UPI001E59804C|nr:LysR family transcriptional regulator [Candidatus Burkholderia verschuerenii]
MKNNAATAFISDDRPSVGISDLIGIAYSSLVSYIQTLAVAEYLSFRHSANVLGVAQSVVSRHIRLLEEDLGVLLFERSTHGVRLTEAGRHFVQNIAVGIDQLDHAVKTASVFARGDRGLIRVGVYGLIRGSFLDALLTRYRAQYGEVIIEITETSAPESIVQLRTRQLDIAFVASVLDLPDCHSRRIWHERLLAVLPAAHAFANQQGVTWADLAGETFLVRYGGTGPQAHNHIVKRLDGLSTHAPSILRCNVGRDTLMQMIA